jgi:hypothetical protein
VSHNHYHFRRDAIDACLELGAWQRAEHHAAALEDYVRQEPLSLVELRYRQGPREPNYGLGFLQKNYARVPMQATINGE